jgi:hypothetical protein
MDMIECIFTLDYEMYGNGTGTLKDLVYEPAERLRTIFRKWDARFVTFVEVAELEKIEEFGADAAISLVKRQVNELCRDRFEIALHLHPQWYNARYEHGRWILDSNEYNLCTLPRPRIAEIVERALNYLRHLVDMPSFTPLSFRAGNWLFQPTCTVASVMAGRGIKIDSSVFKGGIQRNHGLDYRPAIKNGYYWRFERDVNQPDPAGPWIEVPIYTKMVPFWRMFTSKRLSFRGGAGASDQGVMKKLNRRLDFLRILYPLKLDFCRMTLNELTSIMDDIIREDQKDPEVFRPVVAIGHTKDLTDGDTVDSFLSFLKIKGITVSTFDSIYSKLTKLEATS